MGNGQYGFARAAQYYFGRALSTLTADDSDKAALLASIAKSPRDYAPDADDTAPILRRRNQTLALMAAEGFISRDLMNAAKARPLPILPSHAAQIFQSSGPSPMCSPSSRPDTPSSVSKTFCRTGIDAPVGHPSPAESEWLRQSP